MIFKTYRNVMIPLMIIVILISSGIGLVYAERPFITTWSVDGDNTLEIPTTGGGYNYTIDWGDDTIDTGQTGNAVHTYVNAGNYTVSITDDFPRIYLMNSDSAEKLITINQWGDIPWTSMAYAFYGAANMNVTASDVPDLSRVTSTFAMFWGAPSFNGDFSNWDVSNVTTMHYMFFNADSFNGDISNWDVSNVTTMGGMLTSTSLSTNNYDKLLNNWSKLPTLQNDVQFDSSSKYCDAGEIGRSIIIDTYGWDITDAGKDTDENCDDIYKWTINGIIESTSGGFKFPDESIQTKAGITTETDPTFNSSIASSITQTDIDNWNYIQLDTSSDIPPVEDCDSTDEIGRMKIDDSSLKMYVCSYDNTWMIMYGMSSIISAPIITSIVISDPEGRDLVYSKDDIITISFDSDTNTPICTNYCSTSVVNDMFNFSEPIGNAYQGIWNTPSTFTISIKSTGEQSPIIGLTTVTPTGIIPILSADETSEASSLPSSVLDGGF